MLRLTKCSATTSDPCARSRPRPPRRSRRDTELHLLRLIPGHTGYTGCGQSQLVCHAILRHRGHHPPHLDHAVAVVALIAVAIIVARIREVRPRGFRAGSSCSCSSAVSSVSGRRHRRRSA